MTAYPAGYPGVIAVAATDFFDRRASFSNYGTWVDVSAPGVSILSTLPNNSYDFWNGTSMACPNVAGLAALVIAKNPSFLLEDIEKQITGTTDDIDGLNPGLEGMLGTGRINAYNALTQEPHSILTMVGYQADDPTGDQDHFIDPGEEFTLVLTLKNKITETSGVTVTITTSDPCITQIINGSADFGDFAADEEKDNSQNPFVLLTSADFPDQYNFSLEANISASGILLKTVTLSIPSVPVHYPHCTHKEGWPKIWEFTTLDFYNRIIDPLVEDVDNDGNNEVVVIRALTGGNTTRIVILDTKGIQKFPDIDLAGWTDMRPALADLDFDGDYEIIVATKTWGDPEIGTLHVVHHDGTPLVGNWPQHGGIYFNTPVVSDIDNDGSLDILVMSSEEIDEQGYWLGTIYVFEKDGTLKLHLIPPGREEVGFRDLMVGDLNDDGFPEIVSYHGGNKIYVWDHNGNVVNG